MILTFLKEVRDSILKLPTVIACLIFGIPTTAAFFGLVLLCIKYPIIAIVIGFLFLSVGAGAALYQVITGEEW